MRDRIVAATPFFAAALVNLPVVYKLIAWGGAQPWVALGFGFLAMGLAWGSGFVIQDTRRWFALLVGAAGAAEAAAALGPVERVLGEGVRPYLVAAGLLSILGIALVLRARPAA